MRVRARTAGRNSAQENTPPRKNCKFSAAPDLAGKIQGGV
jgi:hypothetical protein